MGIYGYYKAFVVTLGFLEITAGILMLIKKTRIIGCLFTSTILVNVILQDLFYGVHIGALKAVILYQLIVFVVLFLNREKLIQSLHLLISTDPLEGSKKKFLVKMVIALVVFVIIRILEFFITQKW